MNNRMLLKAFKTISKVVLFHTKYLWCSCVSSSFARTVLVFALLHVRCFRSGSQANECVCEKHRNCEKAATAGVIGKPVRGEWVSERKHVVYDEIETLFVLSAAEYIRSMMTWAMW